MLACLDFMYYLPPLKWGGEVVEEDARARVCTA